MSLHNKPEHNTPPIVEALKEHGLAHDRPSQLADAFRLGYRAALASKPPQGERLTDKQAIALWREHLSLSSDGYSIHGGLALVRAVEDSLRSTNADGHALMPFDPTDEMEVAAENDYEESGSPFPNWKAAYRAMRDAALASKPPAECAHEYHYFGDQQTRRRCVWCSELEPEPVASSDPEGHRQAIADHEADTLASKQPAGEQKRCGYCDDTGDVHSIDGEWRGRCTCPAGQSAPHPEPVAPPSREALPKR